MQCAERTHCRTSTDNPWGILWMLPLVSNLCFFKNHFAVLDLGKETADHIHCRKIQFFFGMLFIKQSDSQTAFFFTIAVILKTIHNASDFKDAERISITTVVVNERKQSRQHRITNGSVFRRGNIQNTNIVLYLNPQPFIFFAVAPNIRMHLMQSVFLYQEIFQSIFFRARHGAFYRMQFAACGWNRKVIITVNPGNFFDNICFYRNIFRCTPRRHLYCKVAVSIVYTKSQWAQRLTNLFFSDIDSGISIHICLVKRKRNNRIFLYIHVCHARSNLCFRINLLYQPYKSLDCNYGKLRIQNLFISHTCIGTQSQSRGRFPYTDAVKISRFQHNRGCIVHNFGIQSAHDSGNGYRLLLIPNHQHIRLNFALRAIQCSKVHFSIGSVHHNMMNLVRVKRMSRLSQFQHNIVGQIRQQINRAHSAII